MNISELKQEMELYAGELIKSVKEELRPEELADKEAERLDNIFKQTLKEKLKQLFNNTENIAKLDFDKYEFFYSLFEYYNQSRGDELQAMYYKLNADWFRKQEEILHTGCDEYELDLIDASELRKFFSEDPDDRRERLEGPLQRELEDIDNQISALQDKMNDNRFYEIQFREEQYADFMAKVEKLQHEN